MIVFDLTDASSFDDIDSWIYNIKKDIDPTTPIILLGNKCDLIEKRTISLDEISSFTEANSLQYVETSAKIGTGIEEAFKELAKRISEKKKPVDVCPEKDNCQSSSFLSTKSIAIGGSEVSTGFRSHNSVNQMDLPKSPVVARCC